MNRAVLRQNLPTLLAACAIGGLTIALYAGINLGSMYAYGDLRPFSWYPARDPGAYFRAWQLSGLGNTEQLPPSELLISTIEIVLPFPVALQHVMFLAELPMATISMFLLSRKLFSSWSARASAALFYGINPLTLQEFAGGSMGLLWVYVCLPLIAGCMIAAVRSNRFRDIARLAVVCAVASLFYPHAAAFVFGPVLVGTLLFHLPDVSLLQRARRIVSSAALGLGLYVLLLAPSFVDLIAGYGKIAPTLPSLVMGDVTTTYANSEPWNAFRLLAVAWPGTALNSNGYIAPTLWGAMSSILPGISFIAPLLVPTRTRANPVFAAAIALGIAVVAFDVAVLAGLLNPAFQAVPILLEYRSPVKLNYVLSFSLCLLLGFVLSDLRPRWLRRSVSFGVGGAGSSRRMVREALAFSVVFLITATVATPFYGGMSLVDSDGHRGYTVSQEFIQAHLWLNAQRSSPYDFRTLWIPLDYPTFLQYQGLEKFVFDVPLGADLRGGAFRAIDFIAGTFNAICARDRSFLLNLSLASVRFIIVLQNNTQYPGCTVDDGLLLTNANFLNGFLGGLQGLSVAAVTERYRIYENREFSPPLAVYDRLVAVDYASRDARTLSSAPNLLRNPLFSDRLDSWTVWWASESDVVAGCFSGYNCVRVQSSHEGSSLIKQRFEVREGMNYEVQLWWTLKDTIDASAIFFWYDNATAQESQRIGMTILAGPLNGTRDWEQLVRVATAPPGAIAADLAIIASTNITAALKPSVSLALPVVRPVFVNPGGVPDGGQTLAAVGNIPSFSLKQDLVLDSALLPASIWKSATNVVFNGLPQPTGEFGSWLSIIEPERAAYDVDGNWTMGSDPGSARLLDSNGTIGLDLQSPGALTLSVGLLVSHPSSPPDVTLEIGGSPIPLLRYPIPTSDTSWLVGNVTLSRPGNQHAVLRASSPNLTFVQLLFGPDSQVVRAVTGRPLHAMSAGETVWSFSPEAGYRVQIADPDAIAVRISQAFSGEWVGRVGSGSLPHFTDGVFNVFFLNGSFGSPFVVTIRYDSDGLRQLSFAAQFVAWLLLLLALLVPAGVFYSVGMRLLPPASEDDRWVRLNRDKLGALLRQELRPTPGRPILDVGCGPGAYLSRISDTMGQSCTVIGVDVSWDSLKEAHIGWPGGQLVRADAARLPFRDGVFGAVLAKDLLHHSDEPEEVVREVGRVVSPGGPCVVVEANAAHPFQRVLAKYGNHRHMTHDRLRDIVGSRLNIERVIEAEANPIFYYVRLGQSPMLFLWDLTWAVFQVLGRVLHPLVDFAMKVQARIEVDRAWRGRKAFNIVVAERKVGEDNPR